MRKHRLGKILAYGLSILAAAVAGAFIAVVIDDGSTTIVLPAPDAPIATLEAAAEAPAPEPSPVVLVPADGEPVSYPARIFGAVAQSVVSVQTPAGGGSGFFVDDSGHLITNYHVVQGRDEVMVGLADGRRVPGSIVGSSPDDDLAVVKIDPRGLEIQPVRLGDSDLLVVGERVAAIGNPFGLERTLTTGIVSALGRELPPLQAGGPPQRGAIQTDAAVNPGNSGGPLINFGGEVVGVTSLAFSPVAGSVGVNFAIPVTTVARVLSEMGITP